MSKPFLGVIALSGARGFMGSNGQPTRRGSGLETVIIIQSEVRSQIWNITAVCACTLIAETHGCLFIFRLIGWEVFADGQNVIAVWIRNWNECSERLFTSGIQSLIRSYRTLGKERTNLDGVFHTKGLLSRSVVR